MYTNKEIWRVTYPIFLGLLAQNVINVTDTAFLGRVGEVALGAAAMGGLLYICVYTIAFGFSVGSQILIARRNGEGNYRAVGPIMWQGTAFSFVMAVCLLILMYFSAAPLIRLLITTGTLLPPILPTATVSRRVGRSQSNEGQAVAGIIRCPFFLPM